MPFLILLLFICLPIAEIAVLIKVADAINLLPTIGLIIFTAILGVYLLRMQGLSSLNRAQTALNEGRVPVDSVVDAVALLLSGAFLLTPGLLTDTIGFLLLVPQIRHGLARYLFNKAKNSQNIQVDIFGMSMGGDRRPQDDPFGKEHPDPRADDGPIIEGEIIEPDHTANDDSHDKPHPKGKSPWRRS